MHIWKINDNITNLWEKCLPVILLSILALASINLMRKSAHGKLVSSFVMAQWVDLFISFQNYVFDSNFMNIFSVLFSLVLLDSAHKGIIRSVHANKMLTISSMVQKCSIINRCIYGMSVLNLLLKNIQVCFICGLVHCKTMSLLDLNQWLTLIFFQNSVPQ